MRAIFGVVCALSARFSEFSKIMLKSPGAISVHGWKYDGGTGLPLNILGKNAFYTDIRSGNIWEEKWFFLIKMFRIGFIHVYCILYIVYIILGFRQYICILYIVYIILGFRQYIVYCILYILYLDLESILYIVYCIYYTWI